MWFAWDANGVTWGEVSEDDLYSSHETVFFDIETTGFEKDDEIIRIAACSKTTKFDIFITPSRPVHPKATEINGLEFIEDELFLHGQKVSSVPAEQAFREFLDYLEDGVVGDDVIMVAHNCFAFDMPRLLDLADKLKLLAKLRFAVLCFCDSLIILKKMLKHKRKDRPFTLEALVQDYLCNPPSNLNKAELLQELFLNSSLGPISQDEILDETKNIEPYFLRKESKMNAAQARESLRCYRNIVPSSIIDKMVKAKIDGKLLKQAWHMYADHGIKNLLSQSYNGEPRVTRNKDILENIVEITISEYTSDEQYEE